MYIAGQEAQARCHARPASMPVVTDLEPDGCVSIKSSPQYGGSALAWGRSRNYFKGSQADLVEVSNGPSQHSSCKSRSRLVNSSRLFL